LNSGRREGVITACGVATGSGIFAFAGLAGLLPMVQNLPFFALLMRFVGGGYLVWVGVDMLRSCRFSEANTVQQQLHTSVSAMSSFRIGLLTNLTNPKAWAFYLSLFTLVMGEVVPLWGLVFLNAAMFLVSLGWYVTMAYLMSSQVFQPLLVRLRTIIQAVLGSLLIIVGGKILWG
jgi:threonine/homoserine/homoserine lactone efflux protein